MSTNQQKKATSDRSIMDTEKNEIHFESTENLQDTNTNTDDEDTNKAKDVTIKDLLLYFFLGATTLILKGLSLTPSFSKAIGVENAQVPQAGLAFAIGALLGMVLVTTVYTKLRPKIRVGISAVLQVLGLLLMSIPVHPVNWWTGLIAMAMGVGSMIGTILPLTSYASDKATIIFQLGFALSNLLGAVTSKLFKVKMPRYAMVIIIICFPLLNLAAFYSLDQSPWNHVGVSDDSTDEPNNEDEITNENEIDEEAMKEIELNPPVNSDHEQELDIESDSKDVDDNNNNEVENKKNQGPLSKEEIGCASKQMVFRYWPIWLLAGFTQQVFQMNILFPFESSSFTYGGMPADQVSSTGSNLTIIAFSCSFIFGLTVLTKIGRMISTMNPYLLWVPSAIIITLVITVFVGVTTGAYPPLPLGPYFIYPIIFVSYQVIQIYSPMIIRNDKKLDPRFAEFQLQTLYLMNYLSVFIVSIFGIFFLAGHVLDSCTENYGQLEGTSCTAMLG
jgi:MFS family permease